MTVVLDTWPVLRYLDGGHAATAAVSELLGRERPIMSWVNLGEVFYILRRRSGEAEASVMLRDVQDVLEAELPDHGRVLAAARIKADFPMSYADAFAAATAAAHDAELWTGDPELLVDGAPWRFRDLR